MASSRPGDKDFKNQCKPDPHCQQFDYKNKGQYPIPATNYQVDNPKSVFDAAGHGLNETLTTIAVYAFEFASGFYDGADNDVMEVMVLPVSLAMQAVEAMSQVMVIGEKEEEEERKQFILEIVSAILFVPPACAAATEPR